MTEGRVFEGDVDGLAADSTRFAEGGAGSDGVAFEPPDAAGSWSVAAHVQSSRTSKIANGLMRGGSSASSARYRSRMIPVAMCPTSWGLNPATEAHSTPNQYAVRVLGAASIPRAGRRPCRACRRVRLR